MIKVITKGVLPTDAIYKGTCSNCGCVIEADESAHQPGNYTISRRTRLISVKCPTAKCGYSIQCKKLKQA